MLQTLLDGLGLRIVRGSAKVALTDLTDDSRRARSGCAFLARSGTQNDGSAFIADAVRRGAAAVLAQGPPPDDLPAHVAWAQAEPGVALDQALAGELAERFFDRPSRKLKLLGITGTNGKTTVATLVHHLLNATGMPCGLLGTLGVTGPSGDDVVGDAEAIPALRAELPSLTTPGAIDFSRVLDAMVRSGARALVAEVSSHALDQGRVAALRFAAGAFTNLTGDHLDYHGSMDAYARAKATLFAQLPAHGWAIVNGDDPRSAEMAAAFTGPRDHLLRCSQRTVGSAAKASDQPHSAPPAEDAAVLCRALVLETSATASRARFEGPWGAMTVSLPLVGGHNVSNALQAAALAWAVAGGSPNVSNRLKQALDCCPGVPGRLERVVPPTAAPDTDTPAVLVDYAHTDDALDNVLRALRPVTRGRLIVLFGCGGDRDRTKRPRMAQVACRAADGVWITSDNPRTEDPQAIVNDILQGVPANGVQGASAVHVEVDRARAIEQCIFAAEPGDTVLLAGKGHEDYQIIGHTKRHFDDREHAAAALAAWPSKRGATCQPRP